jgi:hypothetical protein
MTAPKVYHDIHATREFRKYRIELVRKCGFRTKPTTTEAAALDTCATLSVRIARAVHDGCSPDEMCKVVAAHRRALATLEQLAEDRRIRKGTATKRCELGSLDAHHEVHVS